MTTTLTGVFESATDAARARTHLVEAGCSASDITLDPDADGAAGGGAPSLTPASSSDAGTGDRRGFFAKLFGWDDDEDGDDSTRRYSMATERGHVVLAVRVQDESRVDDISRVLEDCGAVDVDERMATWGGSTASGTATGAGHGGGLTGAIGSAVAGAAGALGMTGGTSGTSGTSGPSDAARAVGASTGSGASTAGGEQTLRAVAEELVVGKRTVQRGRVRIHRSVTETPVEEQVSLHEERVRVERVPVDRVATAADLQQGFDERDIELTETAEEAVVSKTARVVEEVRIGSESNDRVETVRDTVRRSEIDVENAEDVPAALRDGGSADGSLGGALSGTSSTGMAGDAASGGSAARYAGPERRRAMDAPFTGFERRQNLV